MADIRKLLKDNEKVRRMNCRCDGTDPLTVQYYCIITRAIQIYLPQLCDIREAAFNNVLEGKGTGMECFLQELSKLGGMLTENGGSVYYQPEESNHEIAFIFHFDKPSGTYMDSMMSAYSCGVGNVTI